MPYVDFGFKLSYFNFLGTSIDAKEDVPPPINLFTGLAAGMQAQAKDYYNVLLSPYAGGFAKCPPNIASYTMSGSEVQTASYVISPASTTQISWNYSTGQGRAFVFMVKPNEQKPPLNDTKKENEVYVKTNSLSSPTNTFTFTPYQSPNKLADSITPYTKFFFKSPEILMRDSLGQTLGNITGLYLQNPGQGLYTFYAWALKDTKI